LDKRSPYEIFVRELVAMDGLDTSEILLIDSLGKILDDDDDEHDYDCDNYRMPYRLQHHAVQLELQLDQQRYFRLILTLSSFPAAHWSSSEHL
jgi:hypothetical protein